MSLEPVPFGKAMRLQHFPFAPSYTPINNGAYGSFPAYVREAHRHFQAELEARPDMYYRYGYPAALLESRKAAASMLHANVDNIVFVANATTGYNTVLRSLVWAPGDVILHYDITYGSLLQTIRYLEETTPVRSHCLSIRFPLGDDELVEAFELAIRNVNAQPGRRVRLAVFDTVASMPGLLLPFERLVRLCKAHGVLSFVDGAHGIGMLPAAENTNTEKNTEKCGVLDLDALDADFLVTNAHKWLHVPRGCGILYVPARNQALIRTPLPTSHVFYPLTKSAGRQFFPSGQSRFVEMFEFVATLDSQHFLTLPAALRWRQEVCGGEDAIQNYCLRLAREGGDRVAKILGTEVMDHPGSRVRECPFANIKLPIEIGKEQGKGQVHPDDAWPLWEWLTHYSVKEHDSYFQVILYHGDFWVRLSAQVYVDTDDFVWAGERLKEMCAMVRNGRDSYIKNGKCRLCAEAAEKSKI